MNYNTIDYAKIAMYFFQVVFCAVCWIFSLIHQKFPVICVELSFSGMAERPAASGRPKKVICLFLKKGLDKSPFLWYNPNISCEEDKQSIANVPREPTAGVSR